jgi:hypothetical protein
MSHILTKFMRLSYSPHSLVIITDMLLIGNYALFTKSNCINKILSLVSFIMEYVNMTIWITVSLILWISVI